MRCCSSVTPADWTHREVGATELLFLAHIARINTLTAIRFIEHSYNAHESIALARASAGCSGNDDLMSRFENQIAAKKQIAANIRSLPIADRSRKQTGVNTHSQKHILGIRIEPARVQPEQAIQRSIF